MDIEDVIKPPSRPELTYPIPETSETSDNQTRRAEKEERNKQLLQVYNEEVRRRKAEDNAKFNGLQIGDIDKKLKLKLYRGFGKEGQNASHTKTLEKEYST